MLLIIFYTYVAPLHGNLLEISFDPLRLEMGESCGEYTGTSWQWKLQENVCWWFCQTAN